MFRVLSQEPDFLEQKSWLVEEVENNLGHKIIFYPKYHCELNFIENAWGWLKSYHRSNCTYNFKDLESGLPNTILNIIPLSCIRKYYRSCLRFMDAYRVGLTGQLLEFTMKKYSGHRRIPRGVDEINNLQTELRLKLEKTSSRSLIK